jgi:hypothetical protein
MGSVFDKISVFDPSARIAEFEAAQDRRRRNISFLDSTIAESQSLIDSAFTVERPEEVFQVKEEAPAEGGLHMEDLIATTETVEASENEPRAPRLRSGRLDTDGMDAGVEGVPKPSWTVVVRKGGKMQS